ncbi:MAG: PAS domain-containing protein [Spirochaetales bacterium]|nr:PAS domain-containing protein [Spirochaetales bacterium]
MKNRPLLARTFSILIVIVLIAIVPLTLFNINSFKKFFYLETESYLQEDCSILKNLFPSDIEPENRQALRDFTLRAAESTNLRITIIREDGQVLADSHSESDAMNNHADRPEIIEALSGGFGSAVRNSATMAYEMMYTAVRLNFADGSVGSLRIARSLSDVHENIRSISRRSILICIIMLAIVGWISLILAGNVSRILLKISSASRLYASGNFTEKLEISRPAEIAAIADDLNLMGRQLNERIETIEEQKNELQLMLNNMTEAVLFTDEELRVLRINGAAEKLFNIEGKNQQGKSILEIFRNSHLNDFAEKLLSKRKSRVEEISLDLPKPVILEVSGTVLYDSTGENINSVLLVMHDITRTKQLEQMRKDFVANVSHELKTPVTLIKGYIETLLDCPAGAPDKSREFLQIMEKHSLRIEAIINDLLTLSGIEKGGSEELTLEKIPAIDLITSAASSCRGGADEKKITISIDCDESIMMNIYPLMAEQALINLIDNAVKYSGTGTKIIIKAESAPDGKTCLRVKDQGCGISPEHQDRIFERFYRVDKDRSTNSGGTGLGLSIVRHIALSHNGTINVESRPGKGAEFILCI